MAKTTTTRRALLGAISAAPVVAAMGATTALAATTSASAGAWHAARSKEEATRLAFNAYDRDHLSPVSDAYIKVRAQWPVSYDFKSDPAAKAEMDKAHTLYDPVQETFDGMVMAHWEALQALALTPAPDLAAVIYKIERIRDEYPHEEVLQSWFDAIASDLRRLTQEGVNHGI